MSSNSAIVPMKADFAGYCSTCSAELPAGKPRQVHRFSRRIYCNDCADNAAGVTKSGPSSDLANQVKLLNRRLARAEKMLEALLDHFEIEVDETPEPGKPKLPTPEQIIEQVRPLFAEITNDVRLEHNGKVLVLEGPSSYTKMTEAARRHEALIKSLGIVVVQEAGEKPYEVRL